ncbi:MAG TPA: NAD(P)-binding domain-containing protein [Tepidisphaeraceae bacterium]|jgi:3-hydroxyisobutyrate dehydrogenase-like beta-hydroxyacid dehydrogenase|nr:NAD(P)-binding domain-containing protein [Tepidisphaeraceae bacterium]
MIHQPSDNFAHSVTAGVLQMGEMGAAIAAVLKARGCRVVTTSGGRSRETTDRANAAGVEVLDSLAAVAHEADVVFSLVVPAVAEQAATDYCDAARGVRSPALYVDLNSVSPELAIAIGDRLKRQRIQYVDGAINGLAKNLTSSATMFLSGLHAQRVAGLFGDAVKTRVLGREVGAASSMKMLLSGLSKGVCALYAELAMLADQRGMLDAMLSETATIYPGIHALVERMLPTYATHAARRTTEVAELESTAVAAGLEPCVITAVRQMHQDIANVSFDTAHAKGWTVESFVRQLSSAARDNATATAGGPTVTAGDNYGQ